MSNDNKFGVVRDYAAVLRRIVFLVKQLRNIKPGIETDWRCAAESHLKYSNLNGKSVLALTITLSPTGCEWARHGGCTMCGEFEGSAKRVDLIDNPQFHVAQFASAIADPRVWEIALGKNEKIEWLRINQEGNFTNPNEMNIEAQETILRLAAHINNIKRITIETRPQYIDETVVEFLQNIFDGSGVELEVGMGVEAANEVVRNICINKQESDEQFRNAVALLKAHEILPMAYVALKPPFLTEREAIDEAVNTAHFASEIGFTRISLEPMSIHPYSLVDVLTRTGDYKVPYLWSVVEVAKKCQDISSIFGIGGIGYYPVPREYSNNHCDDEVNCARSFNEAIIQYNKTRDVTVFNSLSCRCREKWENECAYVNSALKERISAQLDRAERLIPNYFVEHTQRNSATRNQRLLASWSQEGTVKQGTRNWQDF